MVESISDQLASNSSLKANSAAGVVTTLPNLLDNDIALRNFGWNGYQPPLNKLSARYLIDQGYIPENLMSAVVVPQDFDRGLTFYEVTLPLHLKTQKLTKIIKRLNGHNGTNVEWNIKKFKTVQT